jgi:uncharacterized delta-60 repeat protein
VKRLAIFCGLALLVLGPLGVSSAANPPLAGSLDPSFGSGGVVSQSPGGSIAGIAVQPNGKIVVAGNSNTGFALVRYLPDGSLDPSFGAGGHVETDVGGSFLGALALQPDEKIVVAGGDQFGVMGHSEPLTLARYDSDGSLDTSFGTDGITKTVIPAPSDQRWDAVVHALAVLPDGKIVAAGSAYWHDRGYGDYGVFVLARYTPAGSLDPAFGDGGIAQTTLSMRASLEGIVVQPNGRIVATGTTIGEHPYYIPQMALAIYDPDGSVYFKYASTAQSPHYNGGPPTLQHGKIVVAGYAERGSKTFPVVARFGAHGRLDSTFGKHGFAEVKRATLPPTAVLAQNDGKIIIASGFLFDPQRGGTVLRLLPNGRLDTSFGRRGIVSFGAGLSSLALQRDRRILVGDAGTLDRLVGGNNCVVPDLRGKTVGKATASLVKSYCRPGSIATRFSSKVARGRVLSTAPAGGTLLPGGTKIHLVVSKGKPR